MLKILVIQSPQLHRGFLQPETQDVLLQPQANVCVTAEGCSIPPLGGSKLNFFISLLPKEAHQCKKAIKWPIFYSMSTYIGIVLCGEPFLWCKKKQVPVPIKSFKSAHLGPPIEDKLQSNVGTSEIVLNSSLTTIQLNCNIQYIRIR